MLKVIIDKVFFAGTKLVGWKSLDVNNILRVLVFPYLLGRHKESMLFTKLN